jgi:hypothetical protein
MKTQNIATDGGIAFISIWILMVFGWFTNIFNVIRYILNDSSIADITAYQVLEILGIFVGPLGGILGIFSWF